MKKITTFIVMLLISTIMFSQQYIGSTLGEILFQSTIVFSVDSTETWIKKDISHRIINEDYECSLAIHDPFNFKITTCYFDNAPDKGVCTHYKVVYYNLNMTILSRILNKKYNHTEGSQLWTAEVNGENMEFCLQEDEGNIFIIDVCNFYAEN